MAPSPAAVSPDPVLVAVVMLGCGIVAARLIAARREGVVVRRARVAACVVALLLLAGAVVSPVETMGAHYLLTMHLVQVTVLMGFVPPLLLLGLPLEGAGRHLPRPVRTLLSTAVHPAVALVAVNAVLFAWHAPVLYEACLRHEELYACQQVTLLLVSLAFWWPIVEPLGAGPRRLVPFAKLGYILLATIPQTFVGLLFALARHPFYDGYSSAPTLFGMTHLVDQQIAGACMALVTKIALFAAFSVILWRMLAGEEVDGEAPDDGGPGGGGDDDDAPTPVRPPAPAWLGLLDRVPPVEEPAPIRRGEPVTAGR